MDRIILNQIKKFIKDMKEGDVLTKLRKSPFTEGYRAGLDAVSDIINMGENFKDTKNELPSS